MIVLVVGMPGAGKEEFFRVAQEMGYGIVRMGDVVREHAARNGVPMDDRSIGGFASSERERFGPDVWAVRTVERLREMMGSGADEKGASGKSARGHGVEHLGRFVIDGVRSMAEIDRFRAELGDDMVIVAIEADPEKRFQRLVKRGRSDAPRTYEEFLERDRRELAWGLGDAMAKADVRIENNGSLEEFRRRVREFLDGLERG